MSVVDAVCLILGVLNGIFIAAMPKMNDRKPSILRLAGLGVVLASVLVTLAMSALGANFLPTVGATLVLGFLSYFVTKPAFEADEKPAKVPVNTKRVETATARTVA